MWASGKRSRAICDRCGMAHDYADMVEQVENERRTGFYVCCSCLDEDHPQYRVGKIRIVDPQALQRPRPPDNTDRAFFGWPTMTGEEGTGRIGTVTVTTS